MFSQFVAEQLGWYVYALRDPRDHRVFYIGKGVGNRVFQHAQDAAEFQVDSDDETVASAKLALIREILDTGLRVETYLIRHEISSEAQAYEIEAAVLDALLLLDAELDNAFFALTNIAWGHHHQERGLVTAEVVSTLYEAPPAPAITQPVLLIRIPRLWTPQMTSDELYEATHGWWRVGPRRSSAKYAFAVNRGVIRAAYAIDSWRPRSEGDRGWESDLPGKPRWGFDGHEAAEMVGYLHHSVAHLFRPGEASPVKYLNC